MRAAAIALLVLGLLQMAADLAGLPALRGLAIATTASPAPRVFSAVNGLETYSTIFSLEWTDRSGVEHARVLDPQLYARIAGPYNRRNVFGAVVAYGPLLSTNPATRAMYEAIAAYALCGDAPLLRELGVDPASLRGSARIRLEPLPGSHLGDLPRLLEPPCSS